MKLSEAIERVIGLAEGNLDDPRDARNDGTTEELELNEEAIEWIKNLLDTLPNQDQELG